MMKIKKILSMALAFGVGALLAGLIATGDCAFGAEYHPVLEQERGFVGATHVATFTYADMTETNVNTSQTISNLFNVAAKQRVELIGMELVTAFNAGNNATGSVLVTVGDGAAGADFYLDSTELDSNKTEVWSKFGRAYQGVTTATSANMTNVSKQTTAALTGLGSPTTANAVTALGTPTTANAYTGFGAHTTSNTLTALGTPTTANAYTGFGAHTTSNAITGLGTPTTANAVTAYGSTTTSNAITGFEAHTTSNAITGLGTPTTVNAVTAYGSPITKSVVTNFVLEYSGTLYDSTGAPLTNAEGVAVSAITNVTTQYATVLDSLGSPTTAAAITGFGAHETVAAIIGLGTPTTVAAITGLGSPTTAAAITGFGAHETVAAITALGTPTTAAAITGFAAHTTAAAVTAYGSPTTADVLTNITAQTESQTRVTALTDSASGRKVYTAADTIDFVFTPNSVNSLSQNTAGEVRFYFKVIR